MFLNGGKGKKVVGKWLFPSSVFLLTKGSSRLFRSSELLLACARRHTEMLSVEAENEKTKTGPQRKLCKDLLKAETSLELPA